MASTLRFAADAVLAMIHPRTVRLGLGAIVALSLLAEGSAALAQPNLRSTFPGRRVGGGTRGECAARLLAHLVPSDSVFAPGPALTVAVLEGPPPTRGRCSSSSDRRDRGGPPPGPPWCATCPRLRLV